MIVDTVWLSNSKVEGIGSCDILIFSLLDHGNRVKFRTERRI